MPPGALFETRGGVRAVKSEYHYPYGGAQCVLLGSGEYAHFCQDEAGGLTPAEAARRHNATEARELLPDEAPAAQLRRLLGGVRKALEAQPRSVAAWAGRALTAEEAAAIRAAAEDGARQGTPAASLIGVAVRTGPVLERLLTRLLAWCGLCDQERALLRRLAREPLDRTLGLVLADAWEEAGRQEEAEALRTAAGREGLLKRLGAPKAGEVYVLRVPDGEEGFLGDWHGRVNGLLKWWDEVYPDATLIVLTEGGGAEMLDTDALRAAGWAPAPEAGEVAALRQENERLRAALTRLAAYEEGPEVHGGFDSPWAARVARQALEGP